MFRLLRKSLQAPHPTLIAALSLCCHLSSWFKSLSPIWTLPSCLLRCRICSLSISHSLQIVVSLVTPLCSDALSSPWARDAPVPTPDPGSPDTTLQAHPASSFYLPGRRHWTVSVNTSIPVLHPHRYLLVLKQFMLLHIFDSTQAVPFARNTPQSSPTTYPYYIAQQKHPLAY